MVLNPATILHSVHKGTRGSRWAAFFWSYSMIRNDVQHILPYQFDRSVIEIRKALPDKRPGKLGLTAPCHNLLRQWTEL
ncbi:2OG-Fe(II) oxygenase family protein [Komagataeibacter medellinensis]|uniref:hypothetical protein n=1 Tax=Komagataeibacter medellinensis TaxID=1177712 RepID=UPI001E5EE6A9|nr:hypothetical protein [Komagataeibacter medellinensis]